MVPNCLPHHRFARLLLSLSLSIILALPSPVWALRQLTTEGVGGKQIPQLLGHSSGVGLEERSGANQWLPNRGDTVYNLAGRPWGIVEHVAEEEGQTWVYLQGGTRLAITLVSPSPDAAALPTPRVMVADRAGTPEIIQGEFTVIRHGRVRTIGASSCVLCAIHLPNQPGPGLLAHIPDPNAVFPQSYQAIVTTLQEAGLDPSEAIIEIIATSTPPEEMKRRIRSSGSEFANFVAGLTGWSHEFIAEVITASDPNPRETVAAFHQGLRQAFRQHAGVDLRDEQMREDFRPGIRDVVFDADAGVVYDLDPDTLQKDDPPSRAALTRLQRYARQVALPPLQYFAVHTSGLEEQASIQIGRTRVELVQGDITEQKVEAIVNAANRFLAGGSGVDGAINAAAGPSVQRELDDRHLYGIQPGEAVISGAGNLSQNGVKYIIHAVGPVYTKDADDSKVLASAYRASLILCDQHYLTSIAFPSIATGLFGYPLDEGAQVAIRAIGAYLHVHPQTTLRQIRFVLFDDATYHAYAAALKDYADSLQAGAEEIETVDLAQLQTRYPTLDIPAGATAAIVIPALRVHASASARATVQELITTAGFEQTVTVRDLTGINAGALVVVGDATELPDLPVGVAVVNLGSVTTPISTLNDLICAGLEQWGHPVPRVLAAVGLEDGGVAIFT